MRILVSACLLGLMTRYDGNVNTASWVRELAESHTLIPVCPEQLGGLPTPRAPSERQKNRVVSSSGADVTAQYMMGAAIVCQIAEICRADLAILKARSPSCGTGQIYDGTFSHTLTEGNGTAAEKLMAAGLPLFTENDRDECLRFINYRIQNQKGQQKYEGE